MIWIESTLLLERLFLFREMGGAFWVVELSLVLQERGQQKITRIKIISRKLGGIVLAFYGCFFIKKNCDTILESCHGEELFF
jgi:hypothetical protein